MHDPVQILDATAAAKEFAGFAQYGIVAARDFGRGDGEFTVSQPVALGIGGALTPERSELALSHSSRGARKPSFASLRNDH